MGLGSKIINNSSYCILISKSKDDNIVRLGMKKTEGIIKTDGFTIDLIMQQQWSMVISTVPNYISSLLEKCDEITSY
jgi:hypothetical protein